MPGHRCRLPQHSIFRFSLTPQPVYSPTETERNFPPGGLADPSSSAPQHSTLPFSLTAQAFSIPSASDLNLPPGGDASPLSS